MKKPGFSNSGHFDALVRVAAFSAALRGHQLSAWVVSADSATAVCVTCKSSVMVRRSLFEPTMDGLALKVTCQAQLHHQAA
jgi:hypothetical protein